MMHQAGIRRLLLSVAFFASAFPAASQETKPDASAQNASTQNEPAAAFKEAGDDFRKGSFDQAIAKYNEALKSDTQSAEAYTGIVRCYLRQDKVRDAAEHWKRGCTRNLQILASRSRKANYFSAKARLVRQRRSSSR